MAESSSFTKQLSGARELRHALHRVVELPESNHRAERVKVGWGGWGMGVGGLGGRGGACGWDQWELRVWRGRGGIGTPLAAGAPVKAI